MIRLASCIPQFQSHKLQKFLNSNHNELTPNIAETQWERCRKGRVNRRRWGVTISSSALISLQRIERTQKESIGEKKESAWLVSGSRKTTARKVLARSLGRLINQYRESQLAKCFTLCGLTENLVRQVRAPTAWNDGLCRASQVAVNGPAHRWVLAQGLTGSFIWASDGRTDLDLIER